MDALRTTCCIAGGGPAGMMLGLLLARKGLDVIVLEKHGDFLRDFRGDTLHPSTMQVIDELGWFEEFRPLLQTEITTLDLVLGGHRITPVDFSTLRPPTNFLGLMPQWDFLDFLARKAQEYDGFSLRMDHEVTGLVRDGDRVTGLTGRNEDGDFVVHAELVVAADGRSSVVRELAGLALRETGVPIDVLWFRLDKPAQPPPPTLAYVDHGDFVLTIDRGDYYQSGMAITKGSFAQIQAEGLPRLRERIVAACPLLAEGVQALEGWEQVKLLTVQINHLETWHAPGLLCIGDAAHAMSPAFGVGINYAVQDAVAAARLLAGPLGDGTLGDAHLAAVQRRRERVARVVQRIQLLAHRQVARPGGPGVPAPVRWAAVAFAPIVQRVAARFVGIGFRPEHVEER